MTKDGKTASSQPTQALLDATNQPSLADSKSKVVALMKANGIHADFPLVLVKALVSGDWCNYVSDTPGKLSLFCMNPSSQMNEDENLKLAMKLDEGKGLSEDCINKLLKKEFFFCSNSFELREQLRIGTIFSNLFIGNGIATNELKRAHDTIEKRDAAVRRHFNQDKLFGVKLIYSIDNLMNLLLEECLSASSPRDVNESYFFWKDTCFQLERNYFHCNLPSSLSSKRASNLDLSGGGNKKQ